MVSGLFCFQRSSAAPSEGLKVVNGRVILGLDYSDAFELHILRIPFRNPGLVLHALRRVNDMNYFKAFQPVAAADSLANSGNRRWMRSSCFTSELLMFLKNRLEIPPLHHERGYKTPELFRNYFVKGLLRIFFDLVIALEIAELGALDLD